MLARLALRDFVLAREVAVEFERGFCALTGETGAGKSLMVDALALLAGGRASPSLIRAGAGAAEVEAAFYLEGGGDDGDGDGEELIVRRIIARDAKKSRAFVNGRQTPLSMMAEQVSGAVEICGQHAHYSLLKTAAQRKMLDGYAGAEEDAAQVGMLFRKWREAVDSLNAAITDAEKRAAEREELQNECNELRALNFTIERWNDSSARLARLEHASDLAAGCAEALAAMEGEGGAEEKLAKASRTLQDMSRRDKQLNESAEHAAAAMQSLQESARALRLYAQDITSDPRELAECEQFVAEAHKLARKHRLAEPALLGECLSEKESRLDELARAADVGAARKNEKQTRAELDKACARLTKKRAATAKQLQQTATALLPKLSMREAAMKTVLTKLDEPTMHGAEQVEFLIKTRKESEWGGIQQVASGGELSRLGLALQIAGGDFRAAPTAVFDEVDAGIGGGAAAVVGSLLRKLGQTRQVLCVTHLAQVAACADSHWLVRAGEGGAVEVLPLDEGARVEELARMSGGETITESARAHAAELRAQAVK